LGFRFGHEKRKNKTKRFRYVRGGKQTLVCSRTVHSSTVSTNLNKPKITIMNRLKNILFLIISISTLTLLTSCGAISKSKANEYLTEEKGAIPPEFGQDNTTILFITHRRSYNKYLKKNVKKIYKGKYEFISEEELLSDSKYKDINEYRYIFNFDYTSYDYMSSNGYSKNGRVRKFYILDRRNNERFASKMTSSYWSKVQKVYLEKLNEKRMTNKN
tara:strand:+ start:731 stop:1378 length:648 start_codon:yes stop_codon:yes gene_type:complete